MPGILQFEYAQPEEYAARSGSVRESILLGVALCALVRSGEALAGERGISGFDLHSSAAAFSAPPFSEQKTYSPTEFRPRNHSAGSNSAGNGFADAPMLRGTTLWERMSDFKSRDRVRVLTLWETSSSTLSLQAGRRGDPSLQWNSRWMNSGEATRGLLDRLFSVSPIGAGNVARASARSTNPQVSTRQANPPAMSLGK